ncbi:MAG: SDR family NAD(P)-dependent oxidoreductase [Pseudooceanicola sp.]
MHVVITGASRGVGAALRAAYEADGHDVTGVSRKGGDGLIAADMTDAGAIRAMADAIGNRPVDLLVCNAGLYLDKGHSLDDGYPPEMWEEQLAVNVTAPFLCVQALLPNLRAARGRIAIMSSQMGSSTLATGTSILYRVSKAAALNLGFNLAAALKADGIAVGIYHPGWVRTDMGGSAADITVEESADGLVRRFADLDMSTTGTFETWDGRKHAV